MRRCLSALLLSALTIGAVPAFADGCPVAPDIDARQAALIAALRDAPGEMAARPLNAELWSLWTIAPDEASQAMLDAGMRAGRVRDSDRALDRLGALVNYCPFYAEGFNQRAFVHFLNGDHAAALPDLDRALELNPDHVGALSGRALTLIALGREAEGQAALRAALDRNPWLAERALLKPVPGDGSDR